MRKVLIVLHDYNMSGANRSLFDWIEDSENYEYIFLLPRHSTDIIEKIKSLGHQYIVEPYIVAFKDMKSPITIREVIKHLYQNVINPIIKMKLYFKLKKCEISIVHSNSLAVLFGAEISKLLKVPHIWHAREFMEEDHQLTHFNQKHYKKLKKMSYAIFISDVIEKKFKQDFRQYITIYNKINYDKNYIHKETKDNDVIKIMIAGSLIENKGQLEAIKAVELVSEKRNNVELFVCGQGADKNKLEEYIKQRNLKNVFMMGQVKNLIELRKEMDIALMCSSNEALGRVTIEAMYYENLVIGADTGSTPYIIKDGYNGFLYKLGDVHMLADKIIDVIDDADKRKEITKNAKMYALEQFSNPINSKIENYYCEVMNKAEE